MMMRNKSRLDRAYARLLRDHPYGWALYKKFTADELRPGCCGYFDSDGDWHLIVDLTAGRDSVTSRGWTAPSDKLAESMDEKPKFTLNWGPKKSNSVVSHQIGAEVAANILSPISPTVKMMFTCEKDEGAVLTVQNPVSRHLVPDESATLEWMKENRATMLKRYRKIVETHGIWILNKTYTTTRSGVAVMLSKSSAVEIGLGASVPGLATLMPSSAWGSARGDLAAEVHEDDGGVVVFVSGVYFSKKLWKSELRPVVGTETQARKIFRGDSFRPGSGEETEDEDEAGEGEGESESKDEDEDEDFEIEII